MAVIIDDLLNISTKFLRQWNYFNHEGIRSGVISWSREEVVTSSVSIEVNMIEFKVLLKYSLNGSPIKSIINLEYLDSNLGAGKVWYFTCPATLNRCSKLYLYQGKFVSRKAINNGMYDNQTKSKGWREIDSFFTLSDKRTTLVNDLDTPYRKSHYKGKYTKQSQKLIRMSKRLDRMESASLSFLS